MTNTLTKLRQLAADVWSGASTLTNKTIDSASNVLTVRNAALAADTARANLLVNGGFEIWQRGNGPFTSGVTSDRWTLGASLSSVSISRDITNQDSASVVCGAYTYTHVASGYGQCLQLLENFAVLRGRSLSLSVRVKVSVANTVRATIYDSVNGSIYSSYHSGSGAYETLTVTTTPGAAASNIQVGMVVTNVSCTVYIDNAMLVMGTVVADYAPLHSTDDLARCLRYFQKWGPGIAGASMASLQGISGVAQCVMPMQARMGGNPTFSVSAASDFYTSIYGLGNYTVSNIGIGAYGLGTILSLSVTATSWGGVRESGVLQAINANASVALEWNP